jgi:hypothetical protein
MGWEAHSVELFRCRLPLHEMTWINVVAFKAIPDVITAHGCRRPVVPLTDHLLAIVILPVCPVQLCIGGDVVFKNDNAEFHFYNFVDYECILQ